MDTKREIISRYVNWKELCQREELTGAYRISAKKHLSFYIGLWNRSNIKRSNITTLVFRDSNGKEKFIALVSDEQEAITKIQAFLKEHNYKSYYMRAWVEDDVKWFDVGSHNEFFLLFNINGKKDK